MRGQPSRVVRVAVEAAFLLLVVLGAVLAGLDPGVIVALTAAGAVLVGLLEWAFAREARRAATVAEAPPAVETPDTGQPAPRSESEPEPEPEPELAVSERSARAILATGSPPVPDAEPPPPAPEPTPEPPLDEQPVPEPEPEPAASSGGAEREWNVWELERLVREQPDESRREEWAAMLVSLRDFARPDGSLPPEFDELVRESFGELLAAEGAARR